MPGFSKFNVFQRRFPTTPPVGQVARRPGGRPGVTGSPSQSLDPLAKGLMWGSTLLLVIFAVALRGFGVFPILAVGVPVALAVAAMIASMKADRNWDRVIGLLYLLGALLVMFLL